VVAIHQAARLRLADRSDLLLEERRQRVALALGSPDLPITVSTSAIDLS
jgi:hypothetical protein